MNTEKIDITIDTAQMSRAHVTIIGGAHGLARDIVRCGLGSLTLVDFDRVAASNPARQDFYATDLGRYKIEATAADLRKINPEVEIEFLTADICTLSPQEYEEYFGHTNLFIFATDFFPAQARGNLEALRMNKPAIWIGIYRHGRAGEIVYHVSGLTEACYRCVCASRYKAFGSGATQITSDGATILDLHLVDAIAGQIAVGILTRGAQNRMGQIIDKLEKRNLLQVKVDPLYRMGEKDLFAQYLGNHPANFSFTTIALPMEREEGCPDCSKYHNEKCS